MHPQRRAPTARALAAKVLTRIERDQAFASTLLDAELERAVQLSPADRRLATELVYGVLRCERALDSRITKHARKGIDDVEVLMHLRIAAYQIAILERIPAFAAVSEAVDLVGEARGPYVARFANAVLRRVAADVQECGRISKNDAAKFSLDPRLVQRVADALGGEEMAYAMFCAEHGPPPLGLRVFTDQDVESFRQVLVKAIPGLRARRGRVAPRALCVTGSGRPNDLPGFESAWSVQEEGSQVVGESLSARHGDVVLDACAGRGNKALLLAEKVGQTGCVDAADLHESKLVALRSRAASLRLPVRHIYPVDWTAGVGDVPTGYDRVLVDAPCSGVGTLRRRPEVAHRDWDRTIPALHELQVLILAQAASRCRRGGRVVYAVCSVLRDEAEAVVDAVLSRGVPLEPVMFEKEHAIEALRGKTSLRLLPHEHGTDGYFLACFKKV